MFPNEQILWMIVQTRHREDIERAQQLALIEHGIAGRQRQWIQLSHKVGGWLVQLGEGLQVTHPADEFADDKL